MTVPELPEVETVRRVLEPQLKGRSISRISVSRPEVISHPQAAEFCRGLTGQTFEGMGRRGKFLIFRLESGDRMMLHLRMTGCPLVTPAGYPPLKHTHVVFHLDNGAELRFADARRFGRFWLIRNDEEDIYSGVQKLGIEPFDGALNGEYLRGCLGGSRRAIKTCLLDQSVIAGIGNIYADEILFEARIRPSRAADSLDEEEWKRLAEIIPERMRFFIEKNEITPEDYLETEGDEYRNTPYLRVYGHDGEPCPVCGRTLCRMVISGRSSVYCPRCQPESD